MFSFVSDAPTYLFVDGGYLRRVFADKLTPFVGASIDLRWESFLMQFKAKRVFYYDCTDENQHAGESEADFRNRIEEENRRVDRINSIPGFFVRLGTLRGSGTRKRQKEVDVLLAVDMLTHSHNRNMTRAILIAGDLDFKPVVEALVQQGTQVTVVSDSKSGSRDLARAADQHQPLTLSLLWRLSVGPHDRATAELFPRDFAYAQDPKGNPVRRGLLDGKDVSLFHDGSEWKAILPVTIKTMMSTRWRHSDKTKLEAFLDFEFGPIQWQV